MKHVSFPLKGTRDYVHGTSIFDELERMLTTLERPHTQIDLAFHQMIHSTTCSFEFRAVQTGDSAVAKLVEEQDGGLIVCINAVDEAHCPPIRTSYDEDAISNQAEIEGATIRSSLIEGYSNSEIMIALCKRLHHEHFKEGCRRWVFSRYRGNIPLALEGNITITIAKSIGTRLTCSEIFTAKHKVGDIYFSCIA